MKTIYKKITNTFAAILLMVISLGVSATEKLEVTTTENSRVINLKMDSSPIESMDVFLLNNRDRVIYEDKIERHSSFESTYDFGDLKDGTYTLVSEVPNMRFNRVLEVVGSEVKMTDSYYSFRPHFEVDNDKLLIHYVIQGERNIGISIESSSDILFDSFYGDNTQVFSRAFALEDLVQGSYTLHFTSEEDYYSFGFEVD